MLDEIVRDGARAMLAAALQVEVAAYIDAHADQLDEDGRRLVVRNGYHAEREVMTRGWSGPGPRARINDKRIDEQTRERRPFSSAILPAWARRSPTVAEVLPLLYLHGLSSGDFGPALEQFLGCGPELSASTVVRLTEQWQAESGGVHQAVAHRRRLRLGVGLGVGRGDPLQGPAQQRPYTPVRAIAPELGVTPAQLGLAWPLAQDPAVVPIPGSRSPARVVENAGSARIALDPETLRRVDEALAGFDVAGDTLLEPPFEV